MELVLDIFGAQSMLVDAGPSDGGWPDTSRDKRHFALTPYPPGLDRNWQL